MRKKFCHWVVFGTGLLCYGCTIPWETARTLLVEPAEYPRNIDHNALCLRAHRIAEKAWKTAQISAPDSCGDYRKGFVEGYADFLQYGGTGEPPPLPPRCYWAKDTPQGRQGAMEWFAGFRHGASLARQSGMRDLIVVPAFGDGGHGTQVGTTTAPMFVGPSPEPLHVPPPPTRTDPEANAPGPRQGTSADR